MRRRRRRAAPDLGPLRGLWLRPPPLRGWGWLNPQAWPPGPSAPAPPGAPPPPLLLLPVNFDAAWPRERRRSRQSSPAGSASSFSSLRSRSPAARVRSASTACRRILLLCGSRKQPRERPSKRPGGPAQGLLHALEGEREGENQELARRGSVERNDVDRRRERPLGRKPRPRPRRRALPRPCLRRSSSSSTLLLLPSLFSGPCLPDSDEEADEEGDEFLLLLFGLLGRHLLLLRLLLPSQLLPSRRQPFRARPGARPRSSPRGRTRALPEAATRAVGFWREREREKEREREREREDCWFLPSKSRKEQL